MLQRHIGRQLTLFSFPWLFSLTLQIDQLANWGFVTI